jgi:cysteine-rich repeat protein
MRTAILCLLCLVLARPVAAADGLAFVGRAKNGVGPIAGLHGVSALAISPDGRNVYAASDASSSVVVFRRDPATGALRFVERQEDNTGGVDGLDHVRAVAVSPDGAHLYAAGERDDAVAVFARDAGTGALTFVEVERNGIAGVTALDGPRCLAVSPDGAQVYVGTGVSDAVVVFARDASDGSLTFSTVYQDGLGGVNGLKGTEALAFGPGGRHLYVAASGDDSVAVFARNAADGSLAYLDRYRHSTTVPDGLDGVRSVVVAADDATIYAGGKLDDAVTVLLRDSATSALGFADEVRDTVDGVDGLDAVEALALSADGRLLYAAASNDDSVAVFARDAVTGALTFLHAERDGLGSITSLLGAKALVLSPDGVSVYVAAADSDAIAIFDTRCGDGTVGEAEQCDDGNAVAGDGCSPGCRRECATAADCDDADRCTEAVCRAGECALPECGVRGAACELRAAAPAFLGAAECLPADRRLGRTIRQRLALARAAVQASSRKKPKSATASVARILAGVTLKAGKLADAGAISADCATVIATEASTLASEVGAALERKGLCTP